MKKSIYILLDNQSGVALVIALIMIVVLTLIGLASTFTSTFEIKLSGNKRGSTDAFYAADSGVQVVMANIENFDLPGKYIDNKYNPFTDANNPNPTNAKVVIEYCPNQKGAPRGFGISATQVDFEHYLIESTGEDQIELNPIRSTCTIQQKVVRLVPTLQGGY
jgi:hypothetical protein